MGERQKRGRDERKFDRVPRFGLALPRLRARVDRDLRRKQLGRERVTACAVRLIDLQLFRVGNPRYAKKNGGYGVTTLTQRHLQTTPSIVEFDFVGKSGKRHQRRLRDPRLARLLAQLLELPGHDVFRFFDEDGVLHDLTSRDVNAYVKRHMGEEFTAKDFRTWGGTLYVGSALLELDPRELRTATGRSRALSTAVKTAAERLGNTPAVTRSSYVDPRVLAAVEHPRIVARVRAQHARRRPRRYQSVSEQSVLALLKAMNGKVPRSVILGQENEP